MHILTSKQKAQNAMTSKGAKLHNSISEEAKKTKYIRTFSLLVKKDIINAMQIKCSIRRFLFSVVLRRHS